LSILSDVDVSDGLPECADTPRAFGFSGKLIDEPE